MNTNQTSATNVVVVPTYTELKKEFDWVSDGFKRGQAYDWQLHESCQNVPVASIDSFEFILLFRDMTDEEVFEALKSRGLRPATFEELRIYARANPNKQKEFPIVALGSSCLLDGDRLSPGLHWDGSERCLSLGWSEADWFDDCRFLAVRIAA